jgi:hypothetical protein
MIKLLNDFKGLIVEIRGQLGKCLADLIHPNYEKFNELRQNGIK